MKQSKLLRAILIYALIVLALYALYPTVHSSLLKRERDAKLEVISQKSGVSLDVLKDEIFRFDLDPASRIRNAEGLDEEMKADLIAEIQDLRGTFYERTVEANSGAVKLGLDLSGGMYLVLEVNLVELMDRLAKNRDNDFNQITSVIQEQLNANPTADFESIVLDEFKKHDIHMARYFGDPRQSDREIIRYLRDQADEAINLTLTKLRNRVDEFGVAEPSITKQGARRIVVELPGVQDPARARRLIGRTALLEFKLVAPAQITADVVKQIDTYLAAEIKAKKKKEGSPEKPKEVKPAPIEEKKAEPETEKEEVSPLQELLAEGETDTVTSGLAEALTQAQQEADTTFMLDEERPFSSLLNLYERQIMVPEKKRKAVERFLVREDVKNLIPPDYEFLWGHKPVSGRAPEDFCYLYLVRSRAELTGAALSDARVNISGGSSDLTQTGQAIVNLTMRRDGARQFARITENNIGELLAIVLDDKVHMAPRIKVKIPNGQAIIEGSESVDEANDLAIVLRAGALPAPVDIIEERTVGPSLGADSIKKGTLSGIIGIILVMLAMALYYRGSGLIADLALLLNLVFLVAVLAGFDFSLTMPGIAGIILSLGMAVDANVLIYERIREEIGAGKTIWNAIKAGYARAFITIMDSNITTLIAGVVLFRFGTGPIRGFALTLMIGIAASMFTAIVVTRAIFDWITNHWSLKKLSI